MPPRNSTKHQKKLLEQANDIVAETETAVEEKLGVDAEPENVEDVEDDLDDFMDDEEALDDDLTDEVENDPEKEEQK